MSNIKAYFETSEKPSHDINHIVEDLSFQVRNQKDLCSRLERYANYLTDLAKLSKEFNIDVVTLAKLIKNGRVRNIDGTVYANEYLSIFLDSVENEEKRYTSYFNKEV